MHTETPRPQDAAGQPRPHAYYPPPTSPPPPPPPGVKNYMTPAILVTVLTVLCFVPTGIVAIVYAAKVNPALQLANFAEARRASARAKMWCWISLAVGIACIALFLLIFIAAVASANSTTDYYSSY